MLMKFTVLLISCHVGWSVAENFTVDGVTTTESPEHTYDIEEILTYDGVYCKECDDKYDGPCPLHILGHIKDRKVINKGKGYEHERAQKTAPKNILKLEESSIPGAGFGIWTIKKIPKNTLFGPLVGLVDELADNTTIDDMKWRLPNTDNMYICLMDKSRANYMSYINCPRNVKEENLIRIYNTTTNEFYFKAKSIIPKFTELLVDYGPDFRKTIGISEMDFRRPKDMKQRIFQCPKCLQVAYSPIELTPKHYCPTPTKKDDLWSKVLRNKSLVKTETIYHEKENPKAFKIIYDCKVCKNRSKPHSEKDIISHFYYKHDDITKCKLKTLIRDDFLELNRLCHRYFKCNICANESAGLNWTITPLRSKDSIELDRFFKQLDETEKEMMKKKDLFTNAAGELVDDVIGITEIPQSQPVFKLTTPTVANVTRIKYKLNKRIFFKNRDDAQCHFRKKHFEYCNVTDIRVMKYQGDPHACSLCGNKTQREYFGIDHHIELHLNFTEMFDRGVCQLDYRTKKFNEPYLENFNFSHLFCHKCNMYIDTDKHHEPEPPEVLKHALDHIDLKELIKKKYVVKRKVAVAYRIPIIATNMTFIHCQQCLNFTTQNQTEFTNHLTSVHDIHAYHFKTIPKYIKERQLLPCGKCNLTFLYNADRSRHLMEVHHNYYYCYVCGKTNFYRKTHQNHMLKRHNNSTVTPLEDNWSYVEKLWTSLDVEQTVSDVGTDIFTISTEELGDPTLRPPGMDAVGG